MLGGVLARQRFYVMLVKDRLVGLRKIVVQYIAQGPLDLLPFLCIIGIIFVHALFFVGFFVAVEHETFVGDTKSLRSDAAKSRAKIRCALSCKVTKIICP